MDREYIPVRESHLNYYRPIPLYYVNKDKTFGLYTPPGKVLSDMRLEGGQYPDKLYIKHTDKLRSIHEVQRQFNQQLEGHVKSGDPESGKTSWIAAGSPIPKSSSAPFNTTKKTMVQAIPGAPPASPRWRRSPG